MCFETHQCVLKCASCAFWDAKMCFDAFRHTKMCFWGMRLDFLQLSETSGSRFWNTSSSEVHAWSLKWQMQFGHGLMKNILWVWKAFITLSQAQSQTNECRIQRKEFSMGYRTESLVGNCLFHVQMTQRSNCTGQFWYRDKETKPMLQHLLIIPVKPVSCPSQMPAPKANCLLFEQLLLAGRKRRQVMFRKAWSSFASLLWNNCDWISKQQKAGPSGHRYIQLILT